MAHEYVKISELESTTSFGTADQFVIVQDDETVKIDGSALAESLATLTNLATRSYVDAVVDSAPGTLDTLRELAAALNDDSNFGTNIAALINEKLPTSHFGLEFWNQLATINTYHIQEGSNLYWTQGRFDEAFASKNTYHLVEGSNLYFTEQRVLDVVMPLIPTDVNQLTDASGLLGGVYPTNPTFNSVIISNAVTNPSHATTKAYVDWKVSSIPTPSWNNIANINNQYGPTRIALGRNAGGATDAGGYGGYGAYGGGSSPYAVAIGNSSGKTNQGGAAVAVGVATGYTDQGENAVAIGFTAGNVYQGSAAVAVGPSAGKVYQGVNAVAVGNLAGYSSQGTNAIAIGNLAGQTNQPAGSIVINASGNELNGSVAGLYVDPIRSAPATDYVAYYDPTTKEVTYGPAPTGGGAMSPDPIFNSVTTTNLNVQNVTFTGTGAVTINSGNDLNLVAAGNITFNGDTAITKAQLKSIVAASIDFADFKARIAAL